jgi:hypothetical protein
MVSRVSRISRISKVSRLSRLILVSRVSRVSSVSRVSGVSRFRWLPLQSELYAPQGLRAHLWRFVCCMLLYDAV